MEAFLIFAVMPVAACLILLIGLAVSDAIDQTALGENE
jgi:hypothetical protein